jgi:hypothetical protein
MGRPQLAAHHLVAEKHTVSGENIGKAVIRHFAQPTRRYEGLDLAAIDAADFRRPSPPSMPSARMAAVRGQ